MVKKRDPGRAPDSLELDVDISNFGPISRGKFKIRPLTILIGPNNSGKTYASMLVHSLLSAHRQSAADWSVPEFVRGHIQDPKFHSLALAMKRIMRKRPDSDGYVVIPSKTVDKTYRLAFQNASKHITQEIAKNFGVPLRDLVRIGASTSKLNVSDYCQFTATIAEKTNIKNKYDNYDYLAKRTAGKLLLRPSHMRNSKFDDDILKINNKIYEFTGYLFKNLPYSLDSGTTSLLTLLMHILYHMNEHLPFNSFYFPAARSGIVQAYRPMASGIMRSSSFPSPIIPSSGTSGVLSEFVNTLINTNTKGFSALQTIGNSVETKLFEGKIKLSNPEVGIPKILYRFMKKDIPIHVSSSSVAEIAALSLFLRFGVQKGDMLFIEEPEAHLHPTNQLILARNIVQLVRHGVRVFVTTHSVFFLEKLSMFVKLGSLTEKQRQERNYGKHDYLLDDDVAPYAFRKKSVGNYVMKEISHSATEGISQEEFVNLDIDMYNEGALLDDIISKNSNGLR